MKEDLRAVANKRLELGILKYRNHSETFVGDPVVEARSEVADLWNYTNEARKQRLIGWTRYRVLRALSRVAWRLL